MEEITNQLLNKILDLQEQLAEEKQENKNLEKELKKYRGYVNHLNEESKKQEKRNNDKIDRVIFTSIGFTIFVYLFIKFLLWYFF